MGYWSRKGRRGFGDVSQSMDVVDERGHSQLGAEVSEEDELQRLNVLYTELTTNDGIMYTS